MAVVSCMCVSLSLVSGSRDACCISSKRRGWGVQIVILMITSLVALNLGSVRSISGGFFNTVDFLPWEIRVTFPKESQLQWSRATQTLINIIKRMLGLFVFRSSPNYRIFNMRT